MHRIVMYLLLKVKWDVQNTVLRFEVPHIEMEICDISRGEVTHTCHVSTKVRAILPYMRQDLSN